MSIFNFLKKKSGAINSEEMTHYSLLKSMSEVYYSIHCIDLVDDTVFEFAARNEVKEIVNRSTNATVLMQQTMWARVSDDHLDRMLKFSDLTTVEDRLYGKKMISCDFIGKREGWMRATFVSIETNENDIPTKVVFTTQVIEEDKSREERILLKSNTDEMTGCYNRRAYEQEIDAYVGKKLNAKLVCVLIDVNGLKKINDTLGHSAGDEAIIGVAFCVKKAFWNYGRVFRVGGDEFVAILNVNEEKLIEIFKGFEESLYEYKGKTIDTVSAAVGYARAEEYPDCSYDELEKIAEKMMYLRKDQYYAKTGIDRRGQFAAHKALCNLYSKILSVNLTDDSYQIINMNEDERDEKMGFSDSLSGWLTSFAQTGQVHAEDAGEYLKNTNLDFMRDYFKQDKTSLHVFYRRRIDDSFKQVMMEIIPAEDYTHELQHMYLYVKSIDK